MPSLLQYKNPDLTEAGCDEAGRGPLAGPVFAAAVIMPRDFWHPKLNDSKKMSARDRELLRGIIEKEALAWAVVEVSAQEIDSLNILWASVEGMHRALRQLSVRPEYILVDGNRFKPFEDIPYETVVHGDATYTSIAAASVLAKTYRDDRMRLLAQEYPQYGWDRNMGYPTPEHIEAIKKWGFTPYHRKSFHPKELEPTLF
jgi:ribonuclease HII